MDRNELAGSILRNFRVEYGLTQKVVAERATFAGASCCERHYRRIEHGQMTPSIKLAMALCTVLDTDVYAVWA